MDTLLQDVRFAARSLVRGRGAAAVAILSLALGIAANTTVFSLVQAVEFPRLIYPEASRIVVLESSNHVRGTTGMPVSAPDALDIAAASRTLTQPAIAADLSSILREGTPPLRIRGRRITPAFFDVMRIGPHLGRVLRPGDGPGTIVISHDLWRSAFASDPAIAGRTIRLDGGLVSVVGVMPEGFDPDADVWVLFDPTRGFARDDRQLTLFARLAPSASFADAAAEIEAISRRLALEHPATNRDWTMAPIPLPRLHGRDSRGAFVLLQGAVLFVLLIACANIANILLARATRRRHETAVRVSLGASRGRLLRGLLVESGLLASLGGALGVLLSTWGISLARVFAGFPDFLQPSLNGYVLAFAAAVTVLTGLICGIVPALRSAGVSPALVLRHDDARSPGASRGLLRAGLVAGQIACAVVLATGAALMVRSLVNRQAIDLGFEPQGALRADLILPGDRYPQAQAVRTSIDRLLEHLARAPDVEAAGAATWALPTGAGAQRQLTLPEAGDAALPTSVRRGIEAVTPEYFRALGVPVVVGRPFSGREDRAGSAPVAIINEEVARHLWPDRSPLGEPLRLGTPEEAAPIVTIVGVVPTLRRSAMHDVAIARVYVPFAQHPNGSLSLAIRGRGDLRAAERTLHEAVAMVDPALFAEGVRTLEADVAQFVAPLRLIGVLLGAFSAAGLALAALGVFGTMSYIVSQRQRELAVRAALGAGRRDIVALVFGGALQMTAAGLGAGVLLALFATRALGSFLYGVSPTDPATFAAVVALLAAAAFAACYRPARLAATADPMTLLRQ